MASFDINVGAVTGRLTADAELRYSNSGGAICKFSIANNWSRKEGDQWKDEVNYFDCVLFGRLAESIHKNLTKGTSVSIAYELRQSRYEKDGQKRSSINLVVNKIKMHGGTQNAQRDESYGDDPNW